MMWFPPPPALFPTFGLLMFRLLRKILDPKFMNAWVTGGNIRWNCKRMFTLTTKYWYLLRITSTRMGDRVWSVWQYMLMSVRIVKNREKDFLILSRPVILTSHQQFSPYGSTVTPFISLLWEKRKQKFDHLYQGVSNDENFICKIYVVRAIKFFIDGDPILERANGIVSSRNIHSI